MLNKEPNIPIRGSYTDCTHPSSPPKVVALFASDNSMLAARRQVEDTQDGFCLLLYRSDRKGQERSF